MSKGRKIRSYDYVNHPYEKVRDALAEEAAAVFQAATKGAASRARSVAAELHVNIGGLETGTDISISVESVWGHQWVESKPMVSRSRGLYA